MLAPYRSYLGWIDQQTPEMRDELLRLSNLNSGSYNAAGVGAVADRLSVLFAPLGAVTERIALAAHCQSTDSGDTREHALGPALRLRMRPEAPLQVFLGGHMDTVFPVDSPFQKAQISGDDRLHGPGVADLKGGMLVMLLALSALERSPWRERIGWELLFNPDEEIGSQSSAPLLAEAARRNHFGLVYEPSLPSGDLAGARKGSGNFEVIVRGRAAHAGRDFAAGRNAIRAAADFVQSLDELNGRCGELTINPGYIHGGGALNTVADLCITRFNVRTTLPSDETWMLAQLDELLAGLNARDGISAELRGGFTRPPKPFHDRHRRLAGLIGDCGGALGLDLAFHPTGGCCDGNNLAAHGLPNIDNLGVVGAEIHSDREWMRLSSLPERARLSALLLLRLARGELSWT